MQEKNSRTAKIDCHVQYILQEYQVILLIALIQIEELSTQLGPVTYFDNVLSVNCP